MKIIRVQYVSPVVAAVTRRKEQTVELDGPEPSLADLLEKLCGEHGPRLRQILLDDRGALRRYNHVVINGRDTLHLEGVATRLRDGDRVMFVMPMAGGS